MTTATGIAPPEMTIRDGTLTDLYVDPYPTYRTLHSRGSVHWFPALQRYIVIGFEACKQVEANPETYLSNDPASLQLRAMGHSLIRKDGAQHALERRSYGGVLKPRAIVQTWDAIFAETTAAALSRFRSLGPGADLHHEFTTPLAGENLRRIVGMRNSTAADLIRWSQNLIDGSGNYADDPAVWARSDRSSAEIDEAIRELWDPYRAEPDCSLLARTVNSGLPFESVCANVKLAIVGGLNEPRDLLGTIVRALLEHPDQLAAVLADPSRWDHVFDEGARWVSPLAMYVRTAAQESVLDGYALPVDAKLAILVGAANRDPKRFADPDRFDIDRERLPHLAFGNGPHFCAGSWVSRSMVAGHALPALFSEFPDLRLDPAAPPTAGGWVFRGPLSLPVVWSR